MSAVRFSKIFEVLKLGFSNLLVYKTLYQNQIYCCKHKILVMWWLKVMHLILPFKCEMLLKCHMIFSCSSTLEMDLFFFHWQDIDVSTFTELSLCWNSVIYIWIKTFFWCVMKWHWQSKKPCMYGASNSRWWFVLLFSRWLWNLTETVYGFFEVQVLVW